MSYEVRLSKRARKHLLDIEEWCRLNQRPAPALLLQEFKVVASLLAETPFMGSVYRENYRRHLLSGSQYYVYYVVDDVARVVEIDAVWSTRRRRGPRLR